MKRSQDVPVSYPKPALGVAYKGESPCEYERADARTRTGDPFITSEDSDGSGVHQTPPKSDGWGMNVLSAGPSLDLEERRCVRTVFARARPFARAQRRLSS